MGPPLRAGVWLLPAPSRALRALGAQPGSGSKHPSIFIDQGWFFHLCCSLTSGQSGAGSRRGLGQAAELEKEAPRGAGLWWSSSGEASLRTAGLALQSPVRCVSGCFSSRSEFKSHLFQHRCCCQPRHGFKAGLSWGERRRQDGEAAAPQPLGQSPGAQ